MTLIIITKMYIFGEPALHKYWSDAIMPKHPYAEES